MTWFLLAIAASLMFASMDLLMRTLSVRTSSPRVFSVVFNLWGSAFAVAVFIAQGGSFLSLSRLTPFQYLLIASTCILYGIYERFQFTARQGMDAATYSIILKISSVISFLGAVLYLGESITVAKIAGTSLIIAASMMLVYKNPRFVYSSAMGYALICAVALGITGFLDKPASAPVTASLYSFLVWIVPIGIIAFPGVRISEVIREFRIGGKRVALAALLNVAGYIIYIRALSLAEASQVNPITSTSGILTVLGGIYLLSERDHLKRKIAAGILAFAGVVLLA